MPLIPLICPNCGGNLTVDSDKDAAICEFCGKPYIVKDAIVKNYINNVTNINAENVNIYAQKDFVIKGGVLMEYNGEAVDVVIPDTVKKISSDAFKGTAIESVTMPDSIVDIVRYDEGEVLEGHRAFEGCDMLVHVKISRNIVTLYPYTFDGCSSLKEVEIPEGVESIKSAFNECISLENIILPESIKNIGGAFTGCKSLKQIVIPKNVTEIGWSAFKGCSSLQEVVLPEGLKAICPSAFEGCSSLQQIHLPESITEIGWSAFEDCSSLQQINIPSNVHEIERHVFKGCTSLSKITGADRFKYTEFFGSRYYENEDKKKEEQKEKDRVEKERIETEKWRRRNLGKCQYCGGDFTGLFKKSCKECGKEKDY